MSQPKILILDDDQRWANNVKKWLGSLYIINIASDLEKATKLLEQHNYALIIANALHTDTLKVLRQRYPNKRLVVATSQPSPQEAIRMYDLGALDYFSKKFNEDITERTEKVIKIPVRFFK